jgi:hypothetical protein
MTPEFDDPERNVTLQGGMGGPDGLEQSRTRAGGGLEGEEAGISMHRWPARAIRTRRRLGRVTFCTAGELTGQPGG